MYKQGSEAIGPTEAAASGAGAPLPPASRAPALVQTLAMLRDPVGYLERRRRRLGPVFSARILSMCRLVYVAEPELAREIYRTDRGTSRAGEVREDFLAPLVGSHSLLTLDGEQWLRHRKLLGPAMHGARIERYRDEIAAIAAAEIERWPLGEPLELRPRMQAITLEVILRLVFGIADAQRLERMHRLLPPLLEGPQWFVLWLLPRPARDRLLRSAVLARIVPRNPLTRFRAGVRELDAILYEEIARRRASGVADGHDMLSVMLATGEGEGEPLSDEELRDELVTLLFAGHETTATALAWAFERLVRSPSALGRLEGELRNGSETYLDAVAKETLRARPVVIDTPRLLDEPLRLDGYEVPAGWYVAPAVPLVQRATSRYRDPDTFRPERFLGPDPPVDAWIPFGGGKRRCIGSHLALLELKTVIAEVLGRLRVEAAAPAPERQMVRHVTLVPEHGSRVVAHPRN
jgi:cytochrome P450